MMNSTHASTLNELDLPKTQGIRSRQQRRWLVILNYLGFGGACFMGVSGRLGDALGAGDVWKLILMAGSLASLALGLYCGTLLYFATQKIADLPDRALDERQRQVRDRAMRYAFTILLGGIIVVLWLAWGDLTFDWSLPHLSGAEFLPIALLVQIMASTLPMAVIAWMEPD